MAHGRRTSPPGDIQFKSKGAKWSAADQERLRQKIVDGRVAERLMKCFNGELELSQSQLAIGLKFMDKLVPNLQSQHVELTETTPFAVIPEQMRDQKAWESTFVPPVPAGKPDVAPTATKATKAASSSTKH
jgi:hypothetical protein